MNYLQAYSEVYLYDLVGYEDVHYTLHVDTTFTLSTFQHRSSKLLLTLEGTTLIFSGTFKNRRLRLYLRPPDHTRADLFLFYYLVGEVYLDEQLVETVGMYRGNKFC